MMKRDWLISVCLVASLSCIAFSQSEAKRRRPQKFSSVYTDLKTGCRNSTQPKEIKCQGYGGYSIYIDNFVNGRSSLEIGGIQRDELLEQPAGYWSEKGRKIEWRLADGKPFAVIIRVPAYKPADQVPDGENPFNEKYKTGEILLVRGLGGSGLAKINYKVDVKTRAAEERARELADKEFMTTTPLVARRAEAARAWASFFAAFHGAVKRRDRAALKKMMAAEFVRDDWGSSGDPEEAFKFWDDPNTRGWEAFDKVLSQGAVPLAAWWFGGRPSDEIGRIAPPAANIERKFNAGDFRWYALFRFEDGRWRCNGFVLCCADHHPTLRHMLTRHLVTSGL